MLPNGLKTFAMHIDPSQQVVGALAADVDKSIRAANMSRTQLDGTRRNQTFCNAMASTTAESAMCPA
jgi:hypothetical protein